MSEETSLSDKKKPNEVAGKAPDLSPVGLAEAEIRSKPVPLAFALVPVVGQPGMFRDVILRDVYAEKIEFLDDAARPTRATWGIDRLKLAISKLRFRGLL